MTKSQVAETVLSYIETLIPDAKCELNYTFDYELVIAVMLSAQTTDKSVNHVTKILFSKYKTLSQLAEAKLEDIEDCIHSLGLYKHKAKNIIGIAQGIINLYGGVLPSDKDKLMKLPGIGNKSAGVIRAEVFHIPDLAVDTHILRLAKRFGLASKNDQPIDVERKLKKIIKEESWIKAHHQLIHFGRYYCKAISPMCENCQLKNICKNNC